MKATFVNETKSAIPEADFDAIKDRVLGKDYKLNIIVTNPRKIKHLNLIYRDKDKSTDILSFPISDAEGEIYICPSETKKKASDFGMDYENYFAYLFIHGCIHLKGYDHGRKMDMLESKLKKEFGIR